MSKFNPPGIVWAILLIVSVALIHEYELWIVTQIGLSPIILDVILTVLIGVLKGISLNSDQQDFLYDLLEKILNRQAQAQMEAESKAEAGPTPGMRSSGARPMAHVPLVISPTEIPDRPSKADRWLWG